MRYKLVSLLFGILLLTSAIVLAAYEDSSQTCKEEYLGGGFSSLHYKISNSEYDSSWIQLPEDQGERSDCYLAQGDGSMIHGTERGGTDGRCTAFDIDLKTIYENTCLTQEEYNLRFKTKALVETNEPDTTYRPIFSIRRRTSHSDNRREPVPVCKDGDAPRTQYVDEQVSDVQTITMDWDHSRTLCECGNNDWLEHVGDTGSANDHYCCGDDGVDDAGRISSNGYVCTWDGTSGKWEQLHDDNKGAIYRLDGEGTAYVGIAGDDEAVFCSEDVDALPDNADSGHETLVNNEAVTISGIGFACAHNAELLLASDGSLELDNDEGLTLATCSQDAAISQDGIDNPDFSIGPQGTVTTNNPRPFIASTGPTVHFCVEGSSDGSGTFTTDPDEMESEIDMSMDGLDYSSIYGADDSGISSRDVMGRTASSVCGDDFFDPSLSVDKRHEFFADEYFTYITDESRALEGVACWNNRVVGSGETIGADLLRYFDGAPFVGHATDGSSMVIKFWETSHGESRALPSVFNQFNVRFDVTNIDYGDDDGQKTATATSRYPFYLQKNIPYELDIESLEFSNYPPEEVFSATLLTLEEDGWVTADWDYVSFGNNILTHGIAPSKAGLYKVSLTFVQPGEEELFRINDLSFEVLPVVLVDDGEFLSCDTRVGPGVYDDLVSTLDGSQLIKESAPYCEPKGTKVCSPEGIWIDAEDPDLDNDDNLLRTSLSQSPNLIADSDFDRGGSLDFGEACSVVSGSGEKTPRNLDEVGGHDVDRGSLLDCSGLNNQQVAIAPGGTTLEGEYIFSAWVKGSGELSTDQGSVPFSHTDALTRINITGTAADGVFTISFSGTFLMDGVQLEKKNNGQIERGDYFKTASPESCCPASACWNGEECIYEQQWKARLEDGIDFATNLGEKGYLCLGGNYEFREKSYRWVEPPEEDGGIVRNKPESLNYGFCQVDECFVGRNGADRSGINRTDCIGSGEEFYGHVCEDGSWTTNLKYASSSLMTLGRSKGAYSLYCGDYEYILNHYDYQFDLLEESSLNRLETVVYPYVGQDNFEVPYVDKACVLKYGSSERDIVIALALNAPIIASQPSGNPVTVLDYFNNPVDRIPSSCHEATGDTFVSCAGNSQQVLYNPEYGILLYADDGGVYDDLLGSSLLPHTTEQEQASLFDRIRDFFVGEKNFDTSDEKMFTEVLALQEDYDSFFVYEDSSRKLHVAREAYLHDQAASSEVMQGAIESDEGKELYYVVTLNISGFAPDDAYLRDHAFIPSPVDMERTITLADVFNLTEEDMSKLTYVEPYGEDGVAMSYVYPHTDVGSLAKYRELFDSWFTYTGRLRGELEFPR